MSNYIRVLPRDLFNEASLLKCYGHLWIAMDEKQGGDGSGRFEDEAVSNFDIVQDPSDGSIYVRNIHFTIKGKRYRLYRPLNSRDAWPLYATPYYADDDFDPIRVFDDDGNLSEEMLQLLRS